jgi:hypothetical protein
MTWYEFLIAIIGAGGIGGLIATIANVIQARRKSVSEQKESKIEQTKETVNLVDELLQKQLKWMSERMDQGETVRKQELEAIQQNLGQQLSNIQDENRKQNETIAAQNEQISTISELLQDMKEYLNGGFAEFEERKSRGTKKGK